MLGSEHELRLEIFDPAVAVGVLRYTAVGNAPLGTLPVADDCMLVI